MRNRITVKALAKVYFTPHPCPLPQGERVYYQAPPLPVPLRGARPGMGGVGEGEHLILLQEPLLRYLLKIWNHEINHTYR
jgi:hypothetical protein